MNNTRNDMKLNAFEMSETYQATASIQLRTHPTHSTINFSELGKKLLECARNGDTDEILELINTGAPFTTDWLGASPLHYASQYGHVDTVEALLRSGIAKDARTKIDRTALHVAAQEGHVETVNILVSYGSDVDAKDMLQMTPLHWAVQRGHRDIIEVLLNNGADVNIVNKFDKTPIDIAYSAGYHEYVPLLQNYKGKAKPKVNPIETSIPVRLLKASNTKKSNKSQNANRSFSNKIPISIKQEIIDDDEDKSLNSSSESIKTSKKDLLHNVISNGQTISLTETGKYILNSYKDQQTSSNANNVNANSSSNNKKLIAIYPPSNIVLLSNNQTGSKNDSQIKVMPKKPMTADGKNTKSITVDKLPFYTSKPVSQVVKRYVINTNQTSVLQEKDEEIKKLNDLIKNLKKELEDYKGLIISKDLEIEKLRKRNS